MKETTASTGTGDDARMSRRGVIRAAGAGAMALGLGSAALTTTPAAAHAPALRGPVPTGPGSVSGAPHLPPGFRRTFTSRFVTTGGLRQHVVVGGAGPPLLLVHGWPQTWYAWRLLMPALARHFRVVAVDQRGIGLSGRPATGYDTGTLARDLADLMDALGHQRFAVAGHDTGMPIGYALAADHPDRVQRLAVAEAALPRVGDSPAMFGEAAANNRLWHIPFNRLDTLNEQLVRGREHIYFGWQFATKAAKPLPRYAVRHYVDTLARDPHALHGSFQWYRALDATVTQNEQRVKRGRLTLPVLAVAGATSAGGGVAEMMNLVADDVRSVIIPGTGHWVAEESPERMLAALAGFLAPYRARPHG
ncbi:alpha/beta hydrolase [Actinoplanes sp. NPDC048967]|uniref:alpha/beta fold hydrolase n=1 Tax=Actinoplanes sp. NPDC048967 TaxID=3155269 RepID=UPI0033CCCA99